MAGTTQSYALDYARRGWHVFPLTYKGKDPLPGSRGFYDATKEENPIRSHDWTRNNIGIRTGSESGIVVLDVDAKTCPKTGKTGFDSLADLAREGILDDKKLHTHTVKTGGGGIHFYFEYPGCVVRSANGIRPGLDIRADGGYVVAPPSLHASGAAYAVDKEKPEDIFAPFPESLIQLLAEKKKAPAAATDNTSSPTEGVFYGPGQRRSYLLTVGGSLLRRGLSDEAIEAALQAENEAKCCPPHEASYVSYMAHKLCESYAKGEPFSIAEPKENSPSEQDEHCRVIPAQDLLGEMFSFLKDKAKVKGQATGMGGLDKLLGGGKRRGELTAWHAEAKTGKNTLWHKQMYAWLNQDEPVPIAYASRELTPATEVMPNLMSLSIGKNAWLAELTPDIVESFTAQVAKWPLFFAEGYGHYPIEEIELWMRECVAKGVWSFWFDHLHYCLEEPEDHKEASKFIKVLKALAKKLDVHVDIILQPNQLEDGKKLSLRSIKGGAAIGQAIDNLIILERNDPDAPNVMTLKLEVGRSKLCKRGKITLEYNPETTDFIEVVAVTVPEGNTSPYNNEIVPVRRKGPINFNRKSFEDDRFGD